MVGLHFEHKTVEQPVWIWTTFEHDLNAPDCTGPMPAPHTKQANTSCPETVATNYNFYGENCSGSAKACPTCNASPATNGTCVNPDTSIGAGYCLDAPPNPSGGLSMLCRQVPIGAYPEAEAWNTACQAAIGTSSAWGNYSLISAQWGTTAIAAGCDNVAAQVSGSAFQGPVNDAVIPPPVATGTAMKPLLANTTMESYDRSNCLGCHSKANITNNAGNALSTDFMFWLQLQVFAPAARRPAFAEPPPPAATNDGGYQVAARPSGRAPWLLVLSVPMIVLRRRLSP